ncbi:MAG TPA: hypothetical protein VEY51_15560 [Chondromyces sp.]|nr:hypothetical protein [Chondromyces sp.]
MKHADKHSFIVGMMLVVMVIFLITSASMMNHIQIKTAVDGCIEKNGTPNVEKDFLAFNWSFSCQSN